MRASALLLLAALARPAAAADVARANEIFPLLLADPRSVQLSASYYRLGGRDLGDFGLGHAWGLVRSRLGPQLWLAELDLEGMSYSRVKLGAGTNELEAVDFVANLPLTLRHGDFSFKGMLFHESSHLGDDYIRRTGATGERFSTLGARLLAAIEPWSWVRAYGGSDFLFSTVPSPKRWGLQAGLELMTGDLRRTFPPLRAYLAQDLQAHERAGWQPSYRAVAGARVGDRRAVRFQAGYMAGRSPFGQFYKQAEHRAELSVAFEL